MRSVRILLIVTFVTVLFLFSGLVVALNSNEASIQTFFSSQTIQPGQTVSARVFFTSTSADELQISYVGIHFDWMPNGGFYGYDLSSAPVAISSGGGNYLFDEIAVQVPTNVSAGSHSYYVGIDGTQGSSSTPFSWDSTTSTIEVYGNSQTTAPTPSSTNSGGGQQDGQQNLLLYGAIGAVVVIVALLIIVLVVRKKRTQPKSATKQGAGQPETPGPEHKPNSEQDFNI